MMEMDLVGRVDVLNGFEAPFGITNKRRNKKKVRRNIEGKMEELKTNHRRNA